MQSSGPPDPPAPPGSPASPPDAPGQPAASPPGAPWQPPATPVFAPFFVPPPDTVVQPAWPASAASHHDPGAWGVPAPDAEPAAPLPPELAATVITPPWHLPEPEPMPWQVPAPPSATAPRPVTAPMPAAAPLLATEPMPAATAPMPAAYAPVAPTALLVPPGALPPGYGVGAGATPDGPRWIPSAALPPGYEPETSGGQPDVVLFFRIYSGLACVGGAVTACWGLYEGVQSMQRGGFQLIMPVFYGLMGTFSFGVYLLGVIAPRRPWMHTVGILQIGLGILGSCCTWPIVIPLLIYWLKPEVKKWFDEGAPKLIE